MPNSTEVALRLRRGPLDLDVAFTVEAPWTVLFAPSGAGKTTILRIIAGLDRPGSGRIVSSKGIVLVDMAERTNLPPHRRQVRMVAQRPTLFPHKSVFKNITYRGFSSKPRFHAIDSGRNIAELLTNIFRMCRVEHLLDKMPSQLSGGERQRVDLARALASCPANLLLLDEPFTGLEADLRDVLIRDLRQWTLERELPVLLVTHDLGEVFAANAHVLKMDSGRIVAQGPAAEVLADERDRLLARLTPEPGAPPSRS